TTCRQVTAFPYTPLFRSLLATLDAARREIRARGDTEEGLLDRVVGTPDTLRQLAAVIPAGDAERAGLEGRLESFARSVSDAERLDRKSTRLNSSHVKISY